MPPFPRNARPLFLALALLCTSTAASAQDDIKTIDMKKGKWGHLVQYIGTYRYDDVLNDKDVKASLAKILKGRDIDLGTQLEVSPPIGFSNDCLILQGNPERSGDTNRAYLEICIGEGNIDLGIFDNGKTTVFTAEDGYQYLSPDLRTWIYIQNHQDGLLSKPDNVQIVVQTK